MPGGQRLPTDEVRGAQSSMRESPQGPFQELWALTSSLRLCLHARSLPPSFPESGSLRGMSRQGLCCVSSGFRIWEWAKGPVEGGPAGPAGATW